MPNNRLLSMTKAMESDFLYIVVSKQDILSSNTQSTIDALRSLTRSPEDALKWRERVDIVFDGYNDTEWELFEIPEVRDFVSQLDEAFPFWLFFLTKARFGLQCVMLCFLPPFLEPEAKAEIFPERLGRLFEDHWLPAMNHVCEFTGMTEREIEQMIDRVIEYSRAG